MCGRVQWPDADCETGEVVAFDLPEIGRKAKTSSPKIGKPHTYVGDLIAPAQSLAPTTDAPPLCGVALEKALQARWFNRMDEAAVSSAPILASGQVK